MKIILGKRKISALKHKYQVYSVMITFKKRTSDLLRFSLTDPLRNAL